MNKIMSAVHLALSTAVQWQTCIEEDEAEDSVDESLRRSLRAYIAELNFRLGTPTYSDDLDRLHELKEALHSLDPVYDEMAAFRGDLENLPMEARAFLVFLGSMTLEMARTISEVESNHPQWCAFFAAERKLYADWQAGNGPLAGSPWRLEDEAEAARLSV